MRINYFIWCLLLSTLLSAQNSEQPNVIIICTDDQGYGELSAHGNPLVRTPNLDKLQGQSVRLEDFHVAPMCTPSRSQLMTGLDAMRNGAINVSAGRSLIRPEVKLLPEYFGEAGYATGLFGKWHLGDNLGHRPQDRGFDETYTFLSSYIGSLTDSWENDYFDGTYYRNGVPERSSGYTTDVLFQEAMGWMEEQASTEAPFFCYLPTAAPHWPHYAPARLRDEIKARMTAQSNLTQHLRPRQKHELASYLAMIENVDANVGRLEAFLAQHGLRENTIVVFLSDNGSTFSHLYYPAGMRGHKSQLWEGGHRVPCFLRWPGGKLGARQAVEGLTQVQDLLPTLLDLAGLPASPTPLDGISLAPILRSGKEVPDDRTLVINYGRMSYFQNETFTDGNPAIPRKEGAAVLWKDWRLIEDRELYNLAEDPLQEENVIAAHPRVAKRLRKHLKRWWKAVKPFTEDFIPLTVGDARENPVLLSPAEWANVSMDRQDLVRKGNFRVGTWHLNVVTAGKYLVELRRFPAASGLALRDSVHMTQLVDGRLPAGPAKSVAFARLIVDGKPIVLPVATDAHAIRFVVELSAGRVTLGGVFLDANRKPLLGAHYVKVFHQNTATVGPVEIRSGDGKATFHVGAKGESVFYAGQQLLVSGGRTAPYFLVAGDTLRPEVIAVGRNERVITQALRFGETLIERKISAVDHGFRVGEVLGDALAKPITRWESDYRLAFMNDWNYASCVGGYVPDAYYKSPLVLASNASAAVGILPDLTVISPKVLERANHALSYDLTGEQRYLSAGFSQADYWFHSVYQAADTAHLLPQVGTENAYHMLFDEGGQQLIEQANEWLWNQYGKREQRVAARQQAGFRQGYRDLETLADWRRAAWHQLRNGRWLEETFADGVTGAGIGQRRWGFDKAPARRDSVFGSQDLPWSFSFTSWFNSMRTAYGMAIYANRKGNTTLLDSAAQLLDIIYHAPKRDGAFKCYAAQMRDGSLVWLAGDGKLSPTETGFLGFDMAWTGTWMLRWHAAGYPNREGIIPHCRDLGDFFVRQQAADGFIPSHYAEDGSPMLTISRKLKAETAPIALFLTELYTQTQDEKYLTAARKAEAFVAEQVIQSRQWFDYETFRSCAPAFSYFGKQDLRKQADKPDPASGLYPLNNLTLGAATEAYLLLYKATGETTYLDKGESLLNYLLLFQQVWSNPLVKPYGDPGMLVGGFTTQNSDAEWSDARQAQFGNIILDYYRATGKPAYLERGVAAIRAQFPINPVENFAHKGYPGPVYNTGFHWSVGSGMTAIEIEADFVGDLVIDVTGQTAVGVNGINVTVATFGPTGIELECASPFALTEPVNVVVHRAAEQSQLPIYVNGQFVGTAATLTTFSSSILQERQGK